MEKQVETLKELRTVIAAQQELLRIALYMMTQGPITFSDQRLKCILEQDQMRATCAVAMGAGQSLNTILKLSDDRGIGVRDLYPIARSVVEGFINAAFFVTQPVEISRRALEHRHFAAWKHHNRIIGNGDIMIAIGAADPKLEAARLFPNFAGKGKESWTALNAVDRIGRIGKVVKASAGALIGAYGGIYAVSSEIIHGSVYGMSYFYSAHTREQTVEGFKSGTVEQVIDILIAVSHASSGFLSAFSNVQKLGPLVLVEHDIFKRLFKVATGDEWGGQDE
ncbi:DUF5677 domain-containing protein [Burkholderia sp. BCC1972]|uniref:DUF5677 domain-containing protein n=1 Tax=Burkholderia sp. BCC1972 TaxID=2817438 RepID=UPI002ABE482F|nr:DUF5677 domain-containing protein [Burkholderia sp. BCC1972]